MTLEDLLDFSDSSMPGEKVGAAIGIRVHIESSPSIAFDQRIIQAIRTLLCDIESRVRFRAVEAIGAGPKLASTFQEELESISRSDSNNIVRKKARELLEQYSG
uniref:HEAT repeat domain-containing protein n=1 Tax=Candidatus Methanophagaceae archaeon ANME-1 ERB6 TaxID=2759912 RepID=A0A7G9YRV1_9EURY|nr:hypothetical protein EGEIMDOP_00020 [Methanosarcinales archaeon ANME-1 ERB6]